MLQDKSGINIVEGVLVVYSEVCVALPVLSWFAAWLLLLSMGMVFTAVPLSSTIVSVIQDDKREECLQK